MTTWKIKPIGHPQRMGSYWKQEWRLVILIIVSGVLFNGSMSLGPVVLGQILDLLQQGGGQRTVLWRSLGYLALIAGIQLLRFAKRSSVRIFANRTGAALRRMVYHTILSRSLPELRQEQTGDLMTRAVSDVNACVEGMRKFTTEVFDTGVLMASYLVTLLVYDWTLTLVACLCIPLAMLLAEKLKTVIYQRNRQDRGQMSRVAQATYERIAGAPTLRLYGAEAPARQAYEGQLAELQKTAVRASVLENSMQPIYHLISLAGVVLIIWQGGRNAAAGVWSIGQFSAYLTIFAALAVKASKAAKLFNSVEKARASWKRVQPYLEEQPRLSAEACPWGAPAELTLRDVTVTYPGQDTPATEAVSVTGHAGQILGITGPVACGKSTLGLALQGLYPYEGSICFNGRELRSLCPGEQTGFLLYQSHGGALFSDTIGNNITLGDAGHPADVLCQVCFDRDLEHMPQGLDTPVGAGGTRLSGGQQARVALARTLFHKRPVLVLDDPFAAVDETTERTILEQLRQEYADCLILLISHRIHSFQQLDGVLLLEPGGCRFGTHGELLRQSAVYRNLWNQEGGAAK